MPNVMYDSTLYQISEEADAALAEYGTDVMTGEMSSEEAVRHILVCEGILKAETYGCGVCGKPVGDSDAYLPMYEGRVVDPNTHEWAGFPACEECAEKYNHICNPKRSALASATSSD